MAELKLLLTGKAHAVFDKIATLAKLEQATGQVLLKHTTPVPDPINKN